MRLTDVNWVLIAAAFPGFIKVIELRLDNSG
jgi:hypothetical protein